MLKQNELNLKSEQSTIIGILHFPNRRQKLVDHFNGRAHPDFVCLKPRDKIQKNLYYRYNK